MYYQLNQNKIILKPFGYLKNVSIAILVFFLAMPLMIILIMHSSIFSEIEPKNFAAYLIMSPFLISCLLFFIYSKRQIIFDGEKQTVYKKSIFKLTNLLSFADAGEIMERVDVGIVYVLKSNKDKFGKGFILSERFATHKEKSKLIFDTTILPALHTILKNGVNKNIPDNSKMLFNSGVTKFYQRHPKGYLLPPIGRNKFLPALLILICASLFCWYQFFENKATNDNYKMWPLYSTISLLFITALFTRRIVYNTINKQIELQYFGYVFKKYSIQNFIRFMVVRKTHNGMYNGTDVRMEFKKDNTNKTSIVSLADFGKTAAIEDFIKETEYVIGLK